MRFFLGRFMLTRRHLIWCIAAFWVCVAGSGSFACLAAERRPNIVLIMTDDQGWGDIHSHGNDKIHTPTLDRLAREGARFERFFVCPVCAPTRAGLLTGRYHLRTGVHGVTRGYETMRAGEVTLAEVLKRAGYVTGIFGKWHNGAHYPEHPNGQGFDEFVGFCAGHWNNYFDTRLEFNGRLRGTQGYITDVLTHHALNFIRKNKDRPFFCYIPYNAPHSPFQVPDKYFDKYKAKGLDATTACVYGMVENIDDNIRRILDLLRQLRLEEDTIVVFLTDNGPNSNRYNGGMRGRKGSVHEGGVRVPCFIRWPGHIQPGLRIESIAANIDLMPTLLELAGVASPKHVRFDGVSLADLLLRRRDSLPDRMLFTHRARAGKVELFPGAVRTQRFRAVNYGKGWQLFDMTADPGQKRNIAKEHPRLVRRFDLAYRRWFADVTQAGFEPIPTKIGYPGWSRVELPAHEAFLSGPVRYKGEKGWANDWIAGWCDPKATITWPVEIVTAGTYLVELRYCCPKRDIGGRIEVKIGDKKLIATVRHPHDPEPIPSPDRVPRKEVYEKRWDRLMVGQLELAKGRKNLTLRALACPGRQVMELKAVILQRLP